MGGFYLQSLVCPKRIQLSEDKENSCGSDRTENRIYLPYPSVSQKHCIFMVTKHHVQIIDFKSDHGTFINGRAISAYSPVEIIVNDIIGIGTNQTKDDGRKENCVYKLQSDDIYAPRTSSNENKFRQERKSKTYPLTVPDGVYKPLDTDDEIDISNDDCNRSSSADLISDDDTDCEFLENHSNSQSETELDNFYLNDSKEFKEGKIDKSTISQKNTRKAGGEKSKKDGFEDQSGEKDAIKNKAIDKAKDKVMSDGKDKDKMKNKESADKKRKSSRENKIASQGYSLSEYTIPKKKMKDSDGRTITVEKETTDNKSTTTRSIPSSRAVASTKVSEDSSNHQTTPNGGKRVSINENKTQSNITRSEKNSASTSSGGISSAITNNKDKVIKRDFSGKVQNHVADRDVNKSVDNYYNNDDINNELSRKTNEFLLRIFKWDLASLDSEEDRELHSPLEGELIPQLAFYTSYDDYDKIMSNLILQKIWIYITRITDWKKNPSFYVTMKKNSIKKSAIGLADETITEFEIEIELPLNRSELKDLQHPESHDFLILELPVQINNEKIQYKQIFACTKNYLKTFGLITYKIVTRSLPANIVFQQKLTLRNVCRIDKFIRMAKAIKFLPFTPLMKDVIQPHSDKEVYALPKVPDYKPPKLITNDNLPGNQTEAVLRIAKALAGSDPKICFLEVSRSNKLDIIANIITEIVYDKNKYQTDKRNRILVCARRDDSADGITIKLIDVREKLKNDHKPMEIVRIGNSRTINPRTRHVSLNEMTHSVMNKGVSNTSVDNEVNRLRSKINYINMQLKSSNCSPSAERELKDKLKHCESELLLLKKSCKQPHYYDKEFQDVNNSILWKADVITSISSSFFSHQMEWAFGLESPNKIDICIIDEENFNYEPETLTTLMLGVTKILLIKNPRVSHNFDVIKAKKFGNLSLFSRISENFDINPIISLIH
ncbi:uncharacterized protein LOC103574086 isoform X2 [Microplitis demolitor]|uniref:uncharacterized protein LOC103574086 isoform X2 n=1 Tax=Microplitis demolitor TaxID=69319 RepID=UPI0004CC9557|nr:uncharacterized protein LOC103574086 isoform X2 [Microplitis demolitor]XP_008551658.1 uncharacterized protein LOC103574086 isoform X2 [Microplitis demolitor]XP_014295455.1 uncharacterized protein LOC103574086 isoform X2 [Microplitis demolitor]